jgi:hypothetical protein
VTLKELEDHSMATRAELAEKRREHWPQIDDMVFAEIPSDAPISFDNLTCTLRSRHWGREKFHHKKVLDSLKRLNGARVILLTYDEKLFPPQYKVQRWKTVDGYQQVAE